MSKKKPTKSLTLLNNLKPGQLRMWLLIVDQGVTIQDAYKRTHPGCKATGNTLRSTASQEWKKIRESFSGAEEMFEVAGVGMPRLIQSIDKLLRAERYLFTSWGKVIKLPDYAAIARGVRELKVILGLSEHNIKIKDERTGGMSIDELYEDYERHKEKEEREKQGRMRNVGKNIIKGDFKKDQKTPGGDH